LSWFAKIANSWQSQLSVGSFWEELCVYNATFKLRCSFVEKILIGNRSEISIFTKN